MNQSLALEELCEQSAEPDLAAASDSAAVIDSTLIDGAHAVEHAVQRELLSHPGLKFSSLVIRRIPNGVCLKGVVEVDEDSPEISRLAQRVAGVTCVLDHLVVQKRRQLPAKG